MKNIKQVERVINKLQLAEEIYNRASKKIHNQPMTTQLKELANRKREQRIRLANLVGKESDAFNISAYDRVRVSFEKIGLELEHIYIRRNEKEIVSFCLKREKELEE